MGDLAARDGDEHVESVTVVGVAEEGLELRGVAHIAGKRLGRASVSTDGSGDLLGTFDEQVCHCDDCTLGGKACADRSTDPVAPSAEDEDTLAGQPVRDHGGDSRGILGSPTEGGRPARVRRGSHPS